ncbi:MAG: DUF4345 domain-containing protein [Pseudomonadota bacterium]
MNRLLSRSILAVSGTLLLVVGSSVLFKPEAFAAANGIALPESASLLSEYRAPGGMLIASAALILLGAVRTQYMRLAFALAALVYGSYGVSRLIALVLDGTPSAALTQAMAIELLLGSVCLAATLKLNRSQVKTRQR